MNRYLDSGGDTSNPEFVVNEEFKALIKRGLDGTLEGRGFKF